MFRAIGPGLALLAGLSAGGAVAMTKDHPPIRCSVERAEKLPPELTADRICAAVRNAAAPALIRAGMDASALSVRISVDSDRKLSAAATLNGKALPEHHVGTSDHALNPRAAEMLGTAIAAAVASARQ